MYEKRMNGSAKVSRQINLLSGFNPFEKYESKSDPQVGVKTKNNWNHHQED